MKVFKEPYYMKPSPIHFRRCHLCGKVNIQKDRVERCLECGKFVSPFFYFDDKDIHVTERGLEQNYFKGDYRPLIGLSAYWTLEDIANTLGNR